MKKTILIVDDNPMYIDLLGDMFSRQSYHILSAPNGAKALEVLEAHKVDMIISDIEMPVMNGIAFHASLNKDKKLRNIPFVFMTGTADPRAIGYINEHPKVRLVQKSNLVEELHEIMSELN